MKTFFVNWWPALAVAVVLAGVLVAAQISILNTQPLPPGELESRATALQSARDSARDVVRP